MVSFQHTKTFPEDAVPLPLATAEVTPAWLTDALSIRYPDTVVTQAQVGRIMLGTSTKVWVNLSYNNVGGAYGLPPSLVLKGGFDEHSRDMSYMHENEMNIYRHMAPDLAMNMPACYFAGTDRQRGQSIVLLEDLTLRQAQFFTGLAPLNYRQAEAFLVGMARFHAQWWEHPDLKPGGKREWISTALGALGAGGYASRILQPAMWEQDHYRSFMSRPHGAALSTRLHDPDVVLGGLVALADLQKGCPVTFCHGDTHLGNLYMEPDGTPGFLDPQMRRAPWATDFANHLVVALDPVDRRVWERPLLNAYLRALARHGVDVPSFEEAFFLYRCHIAYALLCWIFNTDRFQPEEINTAVCMRLGTAAIDHGTFDLLRSAPA